MDDLRVNVHSEDVRYREEDPVVLLETLGVTAARYQVFQICVDRYFDVEDGGILRSPAKPEESVRGRINFLEFQVVVVGVVVVVVAVVGGGGGRVSNTLRPVPHLVEGRVVFLSAQNTRVRDGSGLRLGLGWGSNRLRLGSGFGAMNRGL